MLSLDTSDSRRLAGARTSARHARLGEWVGSERNWSAAHVRVPVARERGARGPGGAPRRHDGDPFALTTRAECESFWRVGDGTEKSRPGRGRFRVRKNDSSDSGGERDETQRRAAVRKGHLTERCEPDEHTPLECGVEQRDPVDAGRQLEVLAQIFRERRMPEHGVDILEGVASRRAARTRRSGRSWGSPPRRSRGAWARCATCSAPAWRGSACGRGCSRCTSSRPRRPRSPGCERPDEEGSGRNRHGVEKREPPETDFLRLTPESDGREARRAAEHREAASEHHERSSLFDERALESPERASFFDRRAFESPERALLTSPAMLLPLDKARNAERTRRILR